MKNLSKLTILLLVLVLLAACGATEAPPEPTEPAAEQPTSAPEATEAPAPTEEPEPTEAAEPAILRYADKAADLGTLDPHFAAATNDRNIVDMIFNGLIRYKPGDGTVFEPDLATELPEPEIVDGKQVWTFNLRSGVMCHPSEAVPAYELTSEDVVWSLQKSANADTSAYAGEYSGMTVEAVDESTVQITLDTPLSEVLFFPKVADYAGGFIVCKQSYEALGAEEFKTNPVGTGPFMFESYSPQQNVMLVANEDYFRGRPQLDGVDYRYMPELNSRELGLQSGELDVINGAAEGIWVERMSQEEGILVDVYGVGEVATIHFNVTVEPLDDPLVRKAIAYALDRDEFLALFGEPVSANVYSPVPAQFLAGGLTQEEVAELDLEYAVDRDMARDLMAEAGYADGFSLELVSSERESYLKNYQSMQAQLAEIGIDIEINVVDHSSMHELIREDVNPITIYVAWRPNADVYLTRFYHSDSIVVTGAKPDTNFSHYDQIDDMIEAARAELDADAQVQMWKDAQIKLLEDMVTYPLQYQNQVTARHDYVDFGHELKSVLALYAQITENTTINK
jgi:peptide/nickel transport system substrate-binding protein